MGLFLAWRNDLKEHSLWSIIGFVLGLIIVISNMFLTATNLVKMYVVDGELILSSEKITIKSKTMDLKTARKIEISANDYRGARTSDGSGNWVEITNADNEVTRCRFVIKSKEQKDKLGAILKQWELDGVNIHK